MMRVRGLAAAIMGLAIGVGAGAQQTFRGADLRSDVGTLAPVDGKWDMSFRAPWGDVEMTLDFTQEEERLRGFAQWGARRVTIDRGTIRRDELSFVIVAGDGVTHSLNMEFQGTLRDDTIQGTVGGWDGAPATWTARRVGT